MKPQPYLLAALLVLPLHAGPRTSANYRLEPETVDGGGGRSSSTNYTMDSSLAPGGGLSNAVSAPPVVVKSGYVGQLYEATGIALTADPGPEVGEGATVQLSAMVVLDDATLLAPDPGSVGWSVVAGPLTGIGAAGLATADLVWEDSPATAEAGWGGVTGQLALTVLDTDPDNFGSYAGDGLDDDWQVGFFGPDNPLAGPGFDPDMDGQDNLFESLSGYDPTDRLSFFTLSIDGRSGTTASLRLSKVIAGTRYRIQKSLDLGQSDPFTTFETLLPLSEQLDQPVTDPAAADPESYYQAVLDPAP